MINNDFSDHISDMLILKTGNPIRIRSAEAVGGGCINQCYKLNSGNDIFFIKINDADRYHGMFEAEAYGLKLLHEGTTLRIPQVVATAEFEKSSYILMEYIKSGSRRNDFFVKLGEGIAQLHSQKHDLAGLSHSNYIGSVVQDNTETKNCITFFRDFRLFPLIKSATERNLITREDEMNFIRLLRKLHNQLPNEKPSLLHGDLWSGNYMHDEDGHPVLIDPAVYYGHREADIAMTALFGGFDNSFYDAYNATNPLCNGWKERIDLWNLYPLLVHLLLFGKGYLPDIRMTVNKFA